MRGWGQEWNIFEIVETNNAKNQIYLSVDLYCAPFIGTMSNAVTLSPRREH